MKKTVVLGVTSSVAIYKSVQLVSDLLKLEYDVEVIMSHHATKFISPLMFSSLTKHKTYVDTFDREVDYTIEHIALAKRADIFMIAPATANVIAKVAHGICDDMLTTTFLAATCPKILAPAMNTNMYNNPITQANLQLCQTYGMQIINPKHGLLACGDEGAGKLVDIATLIEAIDMASYSQKTLQGKQVLISAGPTRESIDPVRFISNHSSGKMGYALARAARNMGADVTLVSGPTTLQPIPFVKTVCVTSAEAMAEQIKQQFPHSDYVVMAAAVADFTPLHVASQKIKKNQGKLQLEWKPTEDILATLGKHKTHQKIIGFAMESEHLIENAQQKLASKHCDIIVANNIREKGAGFQGNTNKVTIIKPDTYYELELMSKQDLAYKILELL